MDIRKLLEDHDEAVRYIIFGVLTLVVSWITYALFVFIGVDLALSNILSWICAVLFAFVVNKIYVFRCTGSSTVNLGAELISFFGGRLFTGAVAALLFPLLVAIGLGFTFLGVEGMFARGITSAVEIALNYLISKFIVFRSDNVIADWYSGLPEGLRKGFVKFTIIFTVAAVIFYVAFYLSDIDSEVGTLYFDYASEMLEGHMPYSDFKAEYPPMAMLLILIPGLITESSFTYQIIFAIEVYTFLMFGLYWTYRIAEKYTDKPGRISDLYIVFTIILLDFVLDRYDIFPMVLLIGAVYFFTREKYDLAWIILALGVVTKLYPAVAAPVFLIYLLVRKDYKSAGRGILICAIIGILSILPFLIADPGTAFSFLTYHMDRGLQTESPVASVIMLLGHFDLVDISYVFSYGSDNIAGDLPDAIAKLMVPIMIVCMLALYVFYLMKTRRSTGGDGMPAVILVSFLAVMIFMLANKVLSSQYLVWMIPFSALLVMFAGHCDGRIAMWLFAACVVLTQLNLIVNYAFRDAGEEFGLPGILIILFRNVLLFVLTYYIVKAASKHLSSDGEV
ncbi:MAG: GtrA family protein [Candidatus Methanomethylophilaceae archaeon]|nr:GtrA family protein [Candidatus Methanomethylophilaceae archaeon]